MPDKRYILQKPLPNITIGELFKWDMNYGMYVTIKNDKWGVRTFYSKEIVENSDWFIPEQPTPENKDVLDIIIADAFIAAREAIIKDKELQYRYSTPQDYINQLK